MAEGLVVAKFRGFLRNPGNTGDSFPDGNVGQSLLTPRSEVLALVD